MAFCAEEGVEQCFMATRQVTQYVDDLDGTELDGEGRTVHFSLDGRDYEIDLGNDNEQKLANALAPFIDAARPVRTSPAGRGGSGGRSSSSKSNVDLAAVRKWARENGHEVNDRGRVPGKVTDAFRQAH